MPSRAARWISWMTPRSKRYDSRRPGCRLGEGGTPRAGGGAGQTALRPPSVRACVVDLEVVEPAGRAEAAEVRRVDARDPCAVEESAQLGEVVVADVLLDAVGAEARHLAADVDARLVDRVTECVAGVTAH